MAAAGPLLGGAAGAAGAGGGLGVLGSIISAVVPALMQSSAPTPPAPAPLPPPPQPAEAPKAPEVADTITQPEQVVDTEAARVRAQKRRAEAESRQQLLSLGEQQEDESVTLTKSLLGE